jgi:hypothetical protein
VIGDERCVITGPFGTAEQVEHLVPGVPHRWDYHAESEVLGPDRAFSQAGERR